MTRFSQPCVPLVAAALSAVFFFTACVGFMEADEASSSDRRSEGGDGSNKVGTPAGVTMPAGGPGPGGVPGPAGPPPVVPGQPPGSLPAVECKVGAPLVVGETPVRRLSREEYNNTVRDLFGDDSRPADLLPSEIDVLGGSAEQPLPSALVVDKYRQVAEGVGARAAANLGMRIPCDPASASEEACAGKVVTVLGRRMYRRPLASDEHTALMGLYRWGRQNGSDHRDAVRVVTTAMLQSASFLYRFETDVPVMATGKIAALTSHQVATRLSYLLWSSTPDDALLDAADRKVLGTSEQIAAQARRMLADSRARAGIRNFHASWLELDRLESVVKDKLVFKDFSDELLSLFHKETNAFVDSVVFDGDGRWQTLLAGGFTFANKRLAAFYGGSGPSGEKLEKVVLDAAKRYGLLTQGTFLSVNAGSNEGDPIRRGRFVRERLLCQAVAPPPPDIPQIPGQVAGAVTTRQRFSQHAKDGACAGCHQLMDPLGFAFEHYDGIGKWRTTDHGAPVDASGTLTRSGDVDGPFADARGLIDRLTRSRTVGDCVATMWFRYAIGRAETAEEQCPLDAFRRASATGTIRDLLVALVTMEAFRFRAASGA